MDFVKLELEGTVCVITIDRPKALNALNRQVLTELSEAVAQIAANKVARALILTGSGEKAFVAGADIAEMAALTGTEAMTRGPMLSTSWKLSKRISWPVPARSLPVHAA